MISRTGLTLALLALSGCADGGPTLQRPDAAPDAPRPPDARAPIDARPPADARPDARPAADAAALDAAAPVDAAPPPDAAPPGLTLAPSTVTIARTGTETLTLTLAQPAPAGGAAVTPESDSSGVTVPTSVTIPAGASSAMFLATGVTVGPPIEVRARRGGDVARISARVVPRLVGVTPETVNLPLGGEGSLTVDLEEDVSGGPVSVALAVGPLATAPQTVQVASGSRSATFAVVGEALGVTSLSASIGNARSEARVRVFGLLFSEILYDVSGDDDELEWIELYNATSQPIDTAGMRIQVALSGSFVDSLELSGVVPAEGCAVVGGPLGATGFAYFLAQDFAVDLGNVSSGRADGIQLRAASGVLDSVIYGANNDDRVLDEDGVPPDLPDVADASADHTLERVEADVNGAWVTERTPNPGDCSAIAK
jgi:hypothetical protein